MAGKERFPQIPSTVWWGVRSILKKSPRATIDDRALGAELGVQATAARQYLVELRAVGLITDDGKPTELANRWRMDDTYSEAVSEILKEVYPENLLSFAPPDGMDRQKVVTWFERSGLGRGAAGNKAATYMLLSSPEPLDAPARGTGVGKSATTEKPSARAGKKAGSSRRRSDAAAASLPVGRADGGEKGAPAGMPLNVNVQIHIGADAGAEQIEAIFSAMKRYLYDSADN